MLTQINKPEHGSQAWLDVRWQNDNGEARIAASTAAAVHGQHPFISVTDLAVELLSDTPPQPKEQNQAMERGNRLEPMIREWAASVYRFGITEPKTMFCYDEPGVRLIATLDGITDGNTPVEIKTTTRKWDGELPSSWYWQGVQQAICVNADIVDWIIFDSTMQLNFHTQKVTSDEKRIHIEKCREFLACIDMGMMPDDAVLEYRHVQEIHLNAQPSKEIELPMSALDTLENYLAIKTQREQLETTEDLLKAELCNVLGDAEYGLIQDELVCSWKSSTRESFDSKAFKAAHPALFDKFKKTTTVRTFRVAKDRK